jgi:hypothetical protein
MFVDGRIFPYTVIADRKGGQDGSVPGGAVRGTKRVNFLEAGSDFSGTR